MNIIYGLFDPRDGQLRYVGRSVRGLKRAKEHGNRLDGSAKSCWIAELRALGLDYEYGILERCDSMHSLVESELWNIAYFKAIGCDLFNIHTWNIQGPLGMRHTTEARRKMSVARYGKKRPRPLNERIQISRGHGGRALYDQDGNRYESIGEASRALGILPAAISNVLRGRYRAVNGKFTFRYAEGG